MKEAISLGFEVPDYGEECCPVNPEKPGNQKKKTVYPEFSIRDNLPLIKALKGKVGEEFTALVRLRVSCCEIRDVEKMDGKETYGMDSGANAEIQVLAITPQDITLPSGDSDDESAVDALNEYQRKKST